MSAEQTPAPGKPDTVLFVHGLWMTPRSWDGWIEHFEKRGMKTLAPAWPGMEAEVEALNEDPTPIGELDVETILDHYSRILEGMDRQPIVVGHSFGGLFTLLLLDRGFGAAGVGVAPAAPKGIRDLPLSTLKASAPMFANPFSHKAVPLDEKQFHYAFANTLDQERSNAIRDRYHVPGAASVLREGAAANLHRHPATELGFAKPDRAPLLVIAFDEDHVIPPRVAHHTYEHYESGVLAFKDFPGRPHFPGVEGFEEVADFALDWALDPKPLDEYSAD